MGCVYPPSCIYRWRRSRRSAGMAHCRQSLWMASRYNVGVARTANAVSDANRGETMAGDVTDNERALTSADVDDFERADDERGA